MKIASLFAGIGGFDLAFTRQGHEVVYANEWDSYAADIYDYHFEHSIDRRDLTTVGADELPEFDLLCGGFPCQAFSVAGKRLGFLDTRGTLFFDIARILDQRRPTFVVLENVKGLLSHDSGNTFRVIIESLDGLGYDLQWQVLNSKDFGVPQNRERVFIVGHLRGEPRPQVFPLSPADGAYRQELASTALDANYWKGIDNHGQRTAIVVGQPTYGDGQRSVEYRMTDTFPTIQATQHKNGDNQPKIAQRVPLKFLERNQKNIEGDYAYTVDSMNTGGVKVGMSIRRLTPTECERLQGFPDGWTAQGVKGAVSDTRRYKALGNAVTVNVVEAVIKDLTGS